MATARPKWPPLAMVESTAGAEAGAGGGHRPARGLSGPGPGRTHRDPVASARRPPPRLGRSGSGRTGRPGGRSAVDHRGQRPGRRRSTPAGPAPRHERAPGPPTAPTAATRWPSTFGSSDGRCPPRRATTGRRPSGGGSPVDAHQRGGGDGLRAGSLVTAIDSLGGFLCGLSVQPQWIVTTSVMATLAPTAHVGPLRLDGRVLRRGRNAVVAAVDVFDEGAGDGAVARRHHDLRRARPRRHGRPRRAALRPTHAPVRPDARRRSRSSSASRPGVGPVTAARAGRPASEPVGHPPRGWAGRSGRRCRLPGGGRPRWAPA